MDLLKRFFTEEELQAARQKKTRIGFFKKFILITIAVLLGIFFSAFVLFQTLFLYKVIPHGGIW